MNKNYLMDMDEEQAKQEKLKIEWQEDVEDHVR